VTGPTVELLTEQLIAAWVDWDHACTRLAERQRRERCRPSARDLASQSLALIDAENAVAGHLGVPAAVLRAAVLQHRHSGAVPGHEWVGRPAVRAHFPGRVGHSAPDAVQSAVLDLTPAAVVDQLPAPREMKEAG